MGDFCGAEEQLMFQRCQYTHTTVFVEYCCSGGGNFIDNDSGGEINATCKKTKFRTYKIVEQ